MPTRSRKPKRPADLNRLASSIVQIATEGEPKQGADKNPHAVALGQLGGQRGGKARAKKLSAKRRKEIAQMAAKMRWAAKAKS